MEITSNCGFKLYEATGNDAKKKFIEFRSDLSGTDPNSNFNIADRIIGENSKAIKQLQTKPNIILVHANKISDYYYEAQNVTEVNKYEKGMIILLSLSDNNMGTVSININGIGGLNVMKVVDTNYINLEKNDFKSNVSYLLYFDGVRLVCVGDNYTQDILSLKNKEYIYNTKLIFDSTVGDSEKYVAEINNFNEYILNSIFIIDFSQTNQKSKVILNINNLGEKELKKLDSDGNLISLTLNNCIINKKYLIQDTGNVFVLLNNENYADITNTPQIDNVKLKAGNNTRAELGVAKDVDAFIPCVATYNAVTKLHTLIPNEVNINLPNVFTVRFVSTAEFKAGDKVYLNGVEYTLAYTDDTGSVSAGAWKSGAVVTLEMDNVEKKAYVGAGIAINSLALGGKPLDTFPQDFKWLTQAQLDDPTIKIPYFGTAVHLNNTPTVPGNYRIIYTPYTSYKEGYSTQIAIQGAGGEGFFWRRSQGLSWNPWRSNNPVSNKPLTPLNGFIKTHNQMCFLQDCGSTKIISAELFYTAEIAEGTTILNVGISTTTQPIMLNYYNGALESGVQKFHPIQGYLYANGDLRLVTKLPYNSEVWNNTVIINFSFGG